MTLGQDYFDGMYAGAPDPWGFTDRWYEQRKRAVTLAALPGRRYATAYEPGCSIGVLTRELAPRCDALLATDVAEAALVQARARLADCPHVRLERAAVPQGWPDGVFDLVLLSEVLYYLGDAALQDTAGRAVAALAPGGTLLSVHWRHPVEDYPQSGDAVQAAVHAAAGGLDRIMAVLDDDFALSVHVRTDGGSGASVAAQEGLC